MIITLSILTFNRTIYRNCDDSVCFPHQTKKKDIPKPVHPSLCCLIFHYFLKILFMLRTIQINTTKIPILTPRLKICQITSNISSFFILFLFCSYFFFSQIGKKRCTEQEYINYRYTNGNVPYLNNFRKIQHLKHTCRNP